MFFGISYVGSGAWGHRYPRGSWGTPTRVYIVIAWDAGYGQNMNTNGRGGG